MFAPDLRQDRLSAIRRPSGGGLLTDITLLLKRSSRGDKNAREQLYAVVYPELMQIARMRLGAAGTVSLDAPGLLHEACLRFVDRDDVTFANRRMFFAYASSVMRNVIIDCARARRAEKRGSGERGITLETGVAGAAFVDEDIESLNAALSALAAVDERSHRVVEMRYFGGLLEEEIADILQVSVPTVKRDWRKARAFLMREMSGEA
jgi:RNA polymerase sigma factor (TIGR02999 family)